MSNTLRLASQMENQLHVTPHLDIAYTGRGDCFDIDVIAELVGGNVEYSSAITLPFPLQLQSRVQLQWERSLRNTPTTVAKIQKIVTKGYFWTTSEIHYSSILSSSIEGAALTGICTHLAAMRYNNDVQSNPIVSITPNLKISLPTNPEIQVTPAIEAATQPGTLESHPDIFISSTEQGTTELITRDRSMKLPDVIRAQNSVLANLLGNENQASDAIIRLYGGNADQIADIWEDLRSVSPKNVGKFVVDMLPKLK